MMGLVLCQIDGSTLSPAKGFAAESLFFFGGLKCNPHDRSGQIGQLEDTFRIHFTLRNPIQQPSNQELVGATDADCCEDGLTPRVWQIPGQALMRI